MLLPFWEYVNKCCRYLTSVTDPLSLEAMMTFVSAHLEEELLQTYRLLKENEKRVVELQKMNVSVQQMIASASAQLAASYDCLYKEASKHIYGAS